MLSAWRKSHLKNRREEREAGIMPTREIFWQVQGRPLFYLLVVLAIIVAARGCYAHVRRWQIGTV